MAGKRTNGRAVSRNIAAPPKKTDTRVVRTRNALGDALVELLHLKRFDQITVQDVLDRAGVGRSTFYVHYSGKEDLLLSDADEFFEAMATYVGRREEKSYRVAPVRELFAHVDEWRAFRGALADAGKLQDIMSLGQGQFARGIEQRLADLGRARKISLMRRKAAAQAFAGALFSLLSWWLNHTSTATPEQMDKFFHDMVWAGLGASTDVRAPDKQRTSPADERS